MYANDQLTPGLIGRKVYESPLNFSQLMISEVFILSIKPSDEFKLFTDNLNCWKKEKKGLS